jgi:hypothetical protein
MSASRIDSVEFFDDLASTMAADPERYERLGDIDLELAIVMRRGQTSAFAVRLSFHGISCDGVVEVDHPAEVPGADCWLDGSLEDWQAMFDNITTNGHAVDHWTLNTLTLFGDRISLHATDPMGEDRFHRFNQTLQEFVDAAARLAVGA